jgi:hypothetical protein
MMPIKDLTNQPRQANLDIKIQKKLDKHGNKIEKSSSQGVLHDIFHKIENAIEAIKTAFKPKLERLEIKEQKIQKEYNKITLNSRMYTKLVYQQVNITYQLSQVNEDLKTAKDQNQLDLLTGMDKNSLLKEKDKLENQLKYIDSKLTKINDVESKTDRKELKKELFQVQEQIDTIKQGIISTEKKVYSIEREVDALLNTRRDVGMNKTSSHYKTEGKGNRGLMEAYEKRKNISPEVIAKVEKLGNELHQLEKEVNKQAKIHPEWKAKVFLIKENLHKADLIIANFKLNSEQNNLLVGGNKKTAVNKIFGATDIFETTDIQKREFEIRKEKNKIFYELNLSTVEDITKKLKVNAQKALKVLNFDISVMDLLDRKEPVIGNFFDALAAWRKLPESVDTIHKLLSAANNIKKERLGRTPRESHYNEMLEKIDTQVDKAWNALNRLNEAAITLDQLRAKEQKTSDMKILSTEPKVVPAKREPGVYDFNKGLNELNKEVIKIADNYRVNLNNKEAIKQIRAVHQKLKNLVDENDNLKMMNKYPKLRQKADGIYSAVTSQNYDYSLSYLWAEKNKYLARLEKPIKPIYEKKVRKMIADIDNKIKQLVVKKG